MSLSSGIARLREMQESMKNAAGTKEAMSDRTQKLFRGGFYLMCVLAVAGIALLVLFSSGDMPSAWAFSVGIEAFILNFL